MKKTSQQFALEGGLDHTTAQINLAPGALIGVLNYENSVSGGYQRIGGYERFDGQLATPTLASYTRSDFINGGPRAIAIGDTVTGGTSGATGIVLGISPLTSGAWATNNAAGNIGIHRTTGAFVSNEALNVLSAFAATTVLTVIGGSIDDVMRKKYLRGTQAYYRSLILPVPGSGPVRGVWIYNNIVYAFRNSVDGLTCNMYASSTAGWVSQKTGLAPNGTYQLLNFNFGGASGSQYMYGVSGVHKGFQWDGTTWADITVFGSAQATLDKPNHLAVHKGRLFYSFAKGSLQFSSPGPVVNSTTPPVFNGLTGAGEIGIGDEITNIYSVRQDTLAVWGQSSVSMLYGSTPSDFLLKKNSFQTGAMPFSVQEIDGVVTFVDPRGMFALNAVSQYGDFQPNSIAEKVQQQFVLSAKTLTTSVLSRKKRHIRVFFGDKSALSLSFSSSQRNFTNDIFGGGGASQYGATPNWMRQQYAHQFNCSAAGEIGGAEQIFVGGDGLSDAGYVYNLDVGTSFDGVAIPSLLNTPFFHYGSPLVKKWVRRIELEMIAPLPFTLQLKADFNYGAESTTQVDALSMPNTGGYWDISLWENFFWDAPFAGTPVVNMKGVGRNMALSIAHTDDIDQAFVLQAINVNFDLLSAQR